MNPAELKEAIKDKPVRVGQYELHRLIGEGGMGDIYDAVDTVNGGHVAFKTLRDCHVEPERLLLFKNEFRAVADLAHRNLVLLFDLGQHEALWFFTMERVDGVGLAEAVRRTPNSRNDTGPPTPTAVTQPTRPSGPRARARSGDRRPPAPTRELLDAPACDLDLFVHAVAQILDALEYLHQRGVVHQDLKPSNIMLDDDGVVRLLDFGLAHRIGQSLRLQQDEAVIGTPDYMAPELWTGRPATPASDMFALGCLMFSLLAGDPPPMETSSHARRITRVEALVGGVPVEIAAICSRLLATLPADRPSIAEVRMALGIVSTAPSDAAFSGRLVGRTEELQALRDALEKVRIGANVIVRIEGGSGVGKSSLVRSFLEEVRARRNVLVLRGRCYERESVPYKAFDGIIDELAVRLTGFGKAELGRVLPPWFAELSQVFPVLLMHAIPYPVEVVSALELRRRVLEALYELLARLAQRQPLVLEIDDLQWTDSDSVSLLERLMRQPPPNLLVVLMVRPQEVRDNPDAMRYLKAAAALPSNRTHLVEVMPLQSAEAQDLALQTLRSLALPETMAERIAVESGGVPFFVEELAHSLAQQGGAANAEVHLDHALAERAQALSGPARSLVEVLAVANSPIPRAVACQAAGVLEGAIHVLASLHRGHFVRTAGVRAADSLGIYHDRMGESVVAYLTEERTAEIHLALGRALSANGSADTPSEWLFDAARHLSAARSLLHSLDERLAAARLLLAAGNQARQAASYPLAFRCFEDGIDLLPSNAWETDYPICLGLHAGAAETAYLTATWPVMEHHIAQVKQHGRSVLDQVSAWAVQIDALTSKQDYLAAIDAGVEALKLLGVDLPVTPTQTQVETAFKKALDALTLLGPQGLAALADAQDPHVLAAMRIQVRLCPVAFFVRQPLLALMACNLVTTSVDHGVSYATPNALALFGIILNSSGLYSVSHPWGETAIKMISRWEDRSLEAATRHVVFNFVCPWVGPVRDILASSREVFDIGQRTGDFEYGSYAIHTYTYMAMAAGQPLEPLRDDVLAVGQQMRAFGQFNAVHIHAPFEQLLKALTGVKQEPWNLNDADFNEDNAIAMTIEAGSRSGLAVQHVAIGMARYYFGKPAEASSHLEAARPLLDSVPSTWLIPLCHQFASLAGCACWEQLDSQARAQLRPKMEESLEALRSFAAHGPANFANRVSQIEGELQRIDGNLDGAMVCLTRAIEQATAHNCTGEVAMAHELAAHTLLRMGRSSDAQRYLDTARAHYAQWGASAKAAQLAR